jgi:predicted nucleic acid-binding protein
MIAVDTNILVHAHRRDSAFPDIAPARPERGLRSATPATPSA